MKPTEEDESRGDRTTTKSVPMELEKPTRPALQHGSSSGSGVQRNDATSIGATRFADEKPPEVPDVEMGAEEPCAAQGQAGKDDHGEICVLEAEDGVYDETLGTSTHPAETSGEKATDEDIMATEERNRLKTLGRTYRAPSVDQLIPLYTHSCVARTFFLHTARAHCICAHPHIFMRVHIHAWLKREKSVCNAHVVSLHLALSILVSHPSLLFLDGHFETIPDFDVYDFLAELNPTQKRGSGALPHEHRGVWLPGQVRSHHNLSGICTATRPMNHWMNDW